MSDVGENRIGDRELSTFPSHGWTSLIRRLNRGTCPDEVVGNNIGAVGCSYLSQADMRGLELISLSTFVEK